MLDWKGYAALRSPTHSLNHAIVGFISQCRVGPVELDARDRLLSLVRSASYDLCAQITFEGFGSWEVGLANPSSDIDIQIVRPGKRSFAIPHLINNLKQAFSVVDYPVTVDPAYLRLCHDQSGLEVELYVFDEGRYEECLSRNSRAMAAFFSANPILCALYMIIKHLLKRESLYCPGDTAKGVPLEYADDDEEVVQPVGPTAQKPGISGYVLCWLIIAFARNGLQEMGEEPLLDSSTSLYTIGEILILFLHYYAHVFNYDLYYLQVESELRTEISSLRRSTEARHLLKDKRTQLRLGIHDSPNGVRVCRVPPTSTLYEVMRRVVPLEALPLVILNAELGINITEKVCDYDSVRKLFQDTLSLLKGYVEGTVRVLDLNTILGFTEDYWARRNRISSFVTKGRAVA
ncbi:hypothetical protein GL50803_0095880 [Giardia duodenalis]|uniref:Uncharacterized protein n=1 Tax=Giardia intestinalis (strain ATCC 50803 / WB clone C6) TaxID=184922 RepID=A8BHT0_GIAIC|nr:hypothetical protein GL50803_0095880 [Giardia intestinalis]KAE8302634.1 hypothetical protein GL50803_0095880 [Giardia intestinalis]|eukprot:XP_001706919.1 Hypothetical protein GL50803_95880 [Giardia lamblia ATCC 50803]